MSSFMLFLLRNLLYLIRGLPIESRKGRLFLKEPPSVIYFFFTG